MTGLAVFAGNILPRGPSAGLTGGLTDAPERLY